MSSNTPSRSLMVRDAAGNTKLVKIVVSSPSPALHTASTLSSQNNGASTQQQQQHRFQSVQSVSSSSSSQQNTISVVGSAASVAGTPQKTTLFRIGPSQLGAMSASQLNGGSSGAGSKRPATHPPMITPPPIQKARRSDKSGKGLRHFSMRVCEKVEEKGATSYNEVADELVAEETLESTNAQYDQKNIRRRVYDALNVLMAMNIISKEKKEIRWIGLPSNSIQECQELEKENRERKRRIEAKQMQLKQLILQQVAFTSLVNRNRDAEEKGQQPFVNSAIQLPFIIVNTNKKTHINCSISNDKSEYSFKFDDKFEIHDDIDVLKKMGLLQGLDTGECALEDIERFKKLVPKSLQKFIETYGRGEDEQPTTVKKEDFDDEETCSGQEDSDASNY